MAFEYERTVAAFLPAAQAECETTAQLLPLLDRLGLVCGVSGVFSNLYEANQAWFQATSALQNGFLQDGNGTVFYFQDYLLPQLLSGALSGRPSWVYYPNGLKKLKAHDEVSQVSYLETLRVYLDNNLSVTRTAAALYLHRSTLLDRLAHITQMLGPRSEGSGFLPDARYSAPCGAAAETAGSTKDIISFPLRASRREFIWLQCRSSTIIPDRAA